MKITVETKDGERLTMEISNKRVNKLIIDGEEFNLTPISVEHPQNRRG